MSKKRILAVVLLAALPAVAELAPEVYAALQQKAPEVLSLQVVEVKIDRDWHKPDGCGFFEFEVERDVVVQARVLAVTRSESGLRPGTVIQIPYESIRRCSGYSGARSIPLLEEEEKVVAYLAKNGRYYAPAARGASFESLRTSR